MILYAFVPYAALRETDIEFHAKTQRMQSCKEFARP
jgi:hypothetical protein